MGTPDLPAAAPLPPPPLDPTDEVVRNARSNERRRQLQLMGLAKAFGGGGGGAAQQVITVNKSLLGQ